MLLLCLHLITLVGAAARPPRQHEARQGPISIDSQDPGPISLQTFSSTTTTMSPTTTSEPSSSTPSSSSHVDPSTSSTSISSKSSPSAASAPPSTTTSTAPHTSATPGTISFSVQNLTTCKSGLIAWNYTGTEAELFLSITSIGVTNGSSSANTKRSTYNNTLQQELVVTNTSARSWTWPSVNVTQGWYEIEALVLTSPNLSNNSAAFFVSNGTNVACLSVGGTSPQTSPSGSPSSATSSATSTTNVAAIVGGVIGGVVGAILLIIAGLCLWKQKKRIVRGGGNKNGRWGSLKSVHSSIQPESGQAQVASNHFHTRSESSGATFQGDMIGKASAASTPGGSDEDVAITAEEKPVSPASSAAVSPFDALNTPIHYHYDRRASVYTTQTPTTATDESTPIRATTRRISNQSLEQQAQRIRCSMETSIVRRRSERLSMPTLPPPSLSRIPQSPMLTLAKEEYALSPITATPVNRSVSAGAVSMMNRRASRKPVPQYDPSLLLEDPNADSVSTFTAGADSSYSHGTGKTHGGLMHKASFGDGRPLHYLIPDMPPPQLDN